MSVINYVVYCQTARRTIVPWRITAVGQPAFTFRQFFDTVVRPECVTCTSNHSPAVVLSEVFAKESLDLVDA